MTLQERGRIGSMVVARKAAERAEKVMLLIRQGECPKRAAWKAGVSYRTACRYRRRFG